jgi:hypothetical protein
VTTISELSQKATQRGARMQIMRRWMMEYSHYFVGRPIGCWDEFLKKHPQADDWFDEDGVPK